MEKTPHEKRRKAKKDLILDSARLVFCRKGFLGVTMKDIIEECSISRGGIYLYFSSVDEIFREVVIRRSKSKFEAIRKSAQENIDFFELLDWYFDTQKERLLNMENSLLRATYEYFFTHKSRSDAEFRSAQVESVQKSIAEILRVGESRCGIKNIPELADNLMFVIEGLSVYALLGGITEDHIDKQFSLIKERLRNGCF